MASACDIDHALDRIEASILPSIAITLDALLDVAGDSSSHGAAVRAAELRAIAAQLAAAVRQIDAVTALAQRRVEWPLRMSA